MKLVEFLPCRRRQRSKATCMQCKARLPEFSKNHRRTYGRRKNTHAGTCVAVRAVNFCGRIFRFASASPTPEPCVLTIEVRARTCILPCMCVDEGTCSDPSLEIRCLADKTRAPSKLSIRSPSSTHSRGDRCVQSHSIMGHLLPIHLSSRRSGRYLLTQILNGLAWHIGAYIGMGMRVIHRLMAEWCTGAWRPAGLLILSPSARACRHRWWWDFGGTDSCRTTSLLQARSPRLALVSQCQCRSTHRARKSLPAFAPATGQRLPTGYSFGKFFMGM